MAIGRGWVIGAGVLLAAAALAAGAFFIASFSEDTGGAPAAAGGPGSRLPPPRSLEDLVASGDVIVTGRVGRHFERRMIDNDAGAFEVQAYELGVVEYLRGSGPSTLVVHQVVSPEGSEAAAYALTIPPLGTTGFFFLAPERRWGDGGWSAPFGPDGRVVEGASGAAVLDRKEIPQPEFLAGSSMADFDRAIRRLIGQLR